MQHWCDWLRLYIIVQFVCVHIMLKQVFGVWRHSGLRFGAESVQAREDLPCGSILLVERPACREADSVSDYERAVRDVAAGNLLPNKVDWCPLKGEDVGEMVSASLYEGTALLRFVHSFRRASGPASANADVYWSPFGDHTVVVSTSCAVPAGTEITVFKAELQAEEAESLLQAGAAALRAVKTLNRWKSVELADQIAAAEADVQTVRQAFEESVDSAFRGGSEVFQQFLTQFAGDVGYAVGEPLPAPPTLTSLDCEHAKEVIEVRKELGVRLLEATLKEELQKFKLS